MSESIERLIEQVSRLTEAVQSQNKRLEKLESSYQITQEFVPAMRDENNTGIMQNGATMHTDSTEHQVVERSFTSGPPTTPLRKQVSFSEENIGLYLSRIGMVGLLLGFGFLLKYSFDNDIIGPAGRIAIGYASGILLFGVGEFYRKKFTAWSRVFTGGALVLLYFSTFAAQFFFSFFSLPITVLVLSIITLLGLMISVWYDSPLVFTFAMVGGYLTPFVISGSNTEEAFLRLGYLVLLNIAIVIASHIKKWRLFDVLSFVITSLFFGSLYQEIPTMYAVLFTILYFVIFAFSALSVSFSKLTPERSTVKEISKELLAIYVVAHAGFLYNFMYLIWGSTNDTAFGLFGIIVSLCYMGCAFVAKQVATVPKFLSYILGSISLAILFASINTLATGEWQAILWSIITFGVMYAGCTLKDKILRYIASALFLLSSGAIFFSFFRTSEGIAFVNPTFVSLVIAIMILFATSMLNYREKNLSEDEIVVAGGMLSITHMLLLGHVSLELYDIEDMTKHMYQSLLTAWYGGYAMISVLFGTLRNSVFARYFGMILFVFALIPWLYAIDDMGLPNVGFWNIPFFLLSVPIVGLFISAMSYNKLQTTPADETSVTGIMYGIANILLLALVTKELHLTIESKQAVSVVVSIFYALYAFASLAIGIIFKKKFSRFLGLILFGITISKVVLIDMSGLDLIYRVLAFISIGIVLLLGSYMYQKVTITE